MPTARDQNFAQALIEEGLVSEETVQECMEEMKHAEGIGAAVSLDAVLVKKGQISRRMADAMLESLAMKRLPKTIAGFEVLRPIGRGGMHTVYMARQVSMDRTVALKILSPDLAQNKAYVERLFKEARAVAKLSHVNIIQGIDVGEASGFYYFASEYVDGESVEERLRREGVINEIDTLEIAEQVCRALSHIQSAAGMIHGDIKPANIMLTKTGVAKLADLGLARAIGVGEGIAAGSPHYVSPEQVRNSPRLDIRSDIYSLGATMFHMITGDPPYKGTNAKAIIAKHVSAPIPTLQTLGAQPSQGICKLITTMLAKDPRERHQTPDQLLKDIQRTRKGLAPRGYARRTQSGRAGLTGVRAAPYSRMSPGLIAVIALLVVAAVAAIIAIGTRKPDTTSSEGAVSQQEPKQREEKAAKAYAAAEAFEQKYPDSYSKIVAKYAKVAKNYPSTTWGEEARQAGKAVHKKRDQLARTTFADLKKEADKLAAEDRYFAAMTVLGKYPKKLVFARWGKTVTGEIARLKKKAESRAEELFEKADKLAEEERHDEATEVIQVGRKFGFDNVTEKINARIAVYARAGERAQEARAEEVKEKLEDLVMMVARREQAREYDLARQDCDRFLQTHKEVLDANKAGIVAEVNELKAEVETVRDMWKDILTGLRKMSGSQIDIRVSGILLRGVLREVSETAVVVQMNGNKITKQFSDFDGEELLALAGVSGNAPDTLLRKARFFMATGDIANARKAVEAFTDRDLINTWTVRIAQRGAAMRANATEQEAREALAELRSDGEKKKWKAVFLKIPGFRETYGDTDAFRQAETELDDLMMATEAGLCASLGAEHYTKGKLLPLLFTLRDTIKWQEDNACPKRQDCMRCKGKGYVLKAFPCPRCKATGKVACMNCNGRGTVNFMGMRTRCAVCRGAGRINCTFCRGKGAVPKREVCPACEGARTFECPICHGTGYKERMPQEYEAALAEITERYNISLEAVKELLRE